MLGPTQIRGFQLSTGGQILGLPAAARRIEVIGDSISCGYGNEAKNQNEHFTPKTENAYFTYGADAARALGADYTCIAWSGRKMWPNFTTPEIYDLTIATETGLKWDFSKSPPADVVLINLSTNDFGKGNPDEDAWIKAHEKFVARLRTLFPKAAIYCASSPMMGDWGSNKARTTAAAYLHKIVGALNAAGDGNVRFIDFPVQEQKNGIGADWHPSVKTQALMGEKFAETIRADLHW
jgi:lysophospholipase L1-like esterase